CRTCGRRVRWDARFCPHCGDELDRVAPEDRPWEHPGAPPRRDCEPHRGPLIHTLGVASLCLGIPSLCGAMCLPFAVSGLLGAVLGITAWVLAYRDLLQMDDGVMEVEGRFQTQAGKNYGVAGTVLGGLGIFFSAIVHILPILTGVP